MFEKILLTIMRTGYVSMAYSTYFSSKSAFYNNLQSMALEFIQLSKSIGHSLVKNTRHFGVYFRGRMEPFHKHPFYSSFKTLNKFTFVCLLILILLYMLQKKTIKKSQKSQFWCDCKNIVTILRFLHKYIMNLFDRWTRIYVMGQM